MEDYDSRDDNPKKPVLPGNEEKGGGVVKEPSWENRLLKNIGKTTPNESVVSRLPPTPCSVVSSRPFYAAHQKIYFQGRRINGSAPH